MALTEKQVAVRMFEEDMRIMRLLQLELGVQSQSEIIRMALRSLRRKVEDQCEQFEHPLKKLNESQRPWSLG